MSHSRNTLAVATAITVACTVATTHAGIVGLTGYLNSSAQFQLSGDDEVNVQGAPINGPVILSTDLHGSIMSTQFTSSGFSLMINSTPAADSVSFLITQVFQVTEAVNYSMVGMFPNQVGSRAYIKYEQNSTFLADAHQGTGPTFDRSGTLDVGLYRFTYWSGAPTATNATLFNLAFTPVPGPVALALIGAAGLVGRRRRR